MKKNTSYISLVIPADKDCPDFREIAKEINELNSILQKKNLPHFRELIFVIRKKDFYGSTAGKSEGVVAQNLTLRFLQGGDEQHSSIFIGISQAKGNLIAVMDCDHHPHFFLYIIESITKLAHDGEDRKRKNREDINNDNDDFAFIGLIPEKKRKFRGMKKIRFVGTSAFYSVLKLVILLSLITETFFLVGNIIRVGIHHPSLSDGRQKKILFLIKLFRYVDRITTFSVISERRAKKIKEVAERKGRRYSNYLVAVMKTGNTFFVELPGSFVESMKPKSSGYSATQLIRLAISTFIDVLLK